MEYTKYFKKEKKNPEIVIGGPGTNLECHVDDLFEWLSFEVRCEEQGRDRQVHTFHANVAANKNVLNRRQVCYNHKIKRWTLWLVHSERK